MSTDVKLCECGCGLPTTAIKNDSRFLGLKAGEFRRFRLGHNRSKQSTNHYRNAVTANGWRRLHRVRAERALGKPLPDGAVVHHADGSKGDDAPLVICQDERYHHLLHVRMRIVRAGGNPNTDKICSRCRFVKSTAEFAANRANPDGLTNYCRRCLSEFERARRLNRKAVAC